ncbi:ABC transporter ATP-binding protein [Pseudoduganella namucuonensis]|uniref:ABC-2 type transport system ATP-binding protein n=1 Tax=Pseudoduganella namucuonensis TaxID=1035707 RepID=A0A1I7L4T7_9BURK|nr:ABC transporter ATP-binding protein [Pseudoduganella namucuonensis]SFV04737.1 ABC-2 type transport system ATP-binding protein [Pseudoduganella namucuonensis]
MKPLANSWTGSGSGASELHALRVSGLRKSFGRPAVSGIDLTIAPGEFYGLLGPNGAGKSTTLRMIAGLLAPDAGTIEVFGIDVRKDPLAAKKLIAWVPDEPLLYDKLTVMEYLEFIVGLWRLDANKAQGHAQELLKRLDLWQHRDERCEGFSRGMKQKAALAGALLHEPRLLILDEPLTGLDAAIARQVKDLLLERARQGCTIILTTHLMDVAERMVQRLGIIASGRVLAEGTLDELRTRTQQVGGTLEDIFLRLVTNAKEEVAAS